MAVGLLFIVLMSLAGLVWLWIAALRRPRVKWPSCGQCGYAVEGLERLTCPECGADFRAVGIVTPTQKLLHPIVFTVTWTLLLPIPALLLTTLADRYAPRTVTGVCTFTVQPHSGSFPPVRITQQLRRAGWGRGGGLSGVSVSTQKTADETVTTLSLPVMNNGSDTARFELRKTGGGAPPYVLEFENGDAIDVDEEALESWTLLIADSADRPSVKEDAGELADLIESRTQAAAPFPMRRLALAGGVSTNTIHAEPWWFLALIVTFWAAVYVGGIVIFAVVRRRRSREPTQGTSASTS